jgi:hypothetical protein
MDISIDRSILIIIAPGMLGLTITHPIIQHRIDPGMFLMDPGIVEVVIMDLVILPSITIPLGNFFLFFSKKSITVSV